MNAKWTWLVYMAGDNNLESAGIADLGEMKQVGSTPEVSVLVEVDTEEQKTFRYKVNKGALQRLETLKGINTGDPANLTAFLKWGAQTGPADHYALVVWNHGGGFEDGDFDYDAMRMMRPRAAARRLRMNRALFRSTQEELRSRPSEQRAIALDVGARDYLDNQELRKAVEQSGMHIDLLGCDACLMNMLEIAYEMRATSSVMVGSEETEPGTGWPYAEILGQLARTPTMTAVTLGKAIVDAYAAWYTANGDSQADGWATQSALDLSRLPMVTGPVQKLGAEMAKSMKECRAAIAQAVQGALSFEVRDYFDLGDLARRLARYLPQKSAAAGMANEVVRALDPSCGFMVQKGYWGARVAAANGVSIFFPSASASMSTEDLLADYGRLQFVHDFPGWRDMISAYLRAIRD